MGLIRTAIQFGALFGIAHEGLKVLDHKNQQSQSQQTQGSVYQHPPSYPGSMEYSHQPYCNGGCGQRCQSNGSNGHINGNLGGQNGGKF
jgi:hypothetical protein